MNFQESEAYLYSLGNEVAAMKLGLENITRLLAALDDPQKKYLKVQVAGTNGKGSVCAFLDSICWAAGIKAGVFTSPHLVSVTERIRVGGSDISEEDFARHATVVRAKAEWMVASGKLEYTPTFFEQITAIALVAFAEAEIELAILETGLGGRLDATTAANAEIVAITRIDLDHQEYLGTTIEEIAAEKAAIVRKDSKVIVAPQSEAAERVILRRCRELGVEPIASAELLITKDRDIAPVLSATFQTERASYPRVDFYDMLGAHQLQNAATAISVAETLRDMEIAIGSPEICIGLETAKHDGRLEFIGQFLLEGAHNICGAKALRNFLDEFETRPITLIFGAMAGKDIREMADTLFPKAMEIILTQPNNSRSLTADEILASIPKQERLRITANVEEAINLARSITSKNGLILVTGSLYLVGDVKRILKSQI